MQFGLLFIFILSYIYNTVSISKFSFKVLCHDSVLIICNASIYSLIAHQSWIDFQLWPHLICADWFLVVLKQFCISFRYVKLTWVFIFGCISAPSLNHFIIGLGSPFARQIRVNLYPNLNIWLKWDPVVIWALWKVNTWFNLQVFSLLGYQRVESGSVRTPRLERTANCFCLFLFHLSGLLDHHRPVLEVIWQR